MADIIKTPTVYRVLYSKYGKKIYFSAIFTTKYVSRVHGSLNFGLVEYQTRTNEACNLLND